MKCCVNSCKNNAKRGPKTQGISFHKLPRDPLSRTRWLSALGTPRKVKGKTVVCGEHFCSEDLCLGENGEVSVREGAVPKVSENGDPVNVKICGVCLGMDIKLYDLHMPSLSQAYETLTNIPVGSVASVGAQACALCARRLLNHSRLRTAALSAQQLLTETLAACQQVTPQHIEELDSAEHQLLPKLSFKHYEPLCFDAHSHENDGLNPLRSYSKSTIPLHEVNINIDAKADDSKDFLQENNDTQDSIKSEVDSLRNSDENPIADIDENGHFSSDDDRPILEQKVKRKLVKSAKSKVVTAKQTKKTILNKEPKIDRRKKLLGDDLDEKIFASSQLNSEEQIAEFQKRIQSSNYKNAVYKCTYCFKGFLDEDAYNNHMVRHTDQCGVHECEICKIRFKQPHALRNHVTSHMQKFTCKCCPYVTFRKQTAKLHEEWHNGTKYQCPHCQEEFLKFTTYMGHVRIKHPSDSVCPLCGYSFVSDKGLRLHRKLKHRLDDDSVIPECGPFCERCGVRFLSAEAHQKHLQVSARHADAVDDEAKEVPQRKQRKPREIKNNTKEVVEMDAKKKKKRPPTVKPEGPIPCEQCNAQLEDSRAYYKHFRRAHPDKNRTNYPSMKSPCMCERCGRMFQTLALLVDHAHVHSSEKRFKCSLCSKTFQQKQRLVAHAHIHSAQRAVYVCGVCGKHFSTHSNRQRHMFSHTGLKPFKCEMCGKCFKHASEKRAHVGYVHLKKPWPKRARHKRPRDLYEAPPAHREPQRDMEIVDPLWPPCADPKLGPHLLPDKPVYYNLKM